ncbi:MAG: CRTAC1 family protein [Acidobacteriota bacterium]
MPFSDHSLRTAAGLTVAGLLFAGPFFAAPRAVGEEIFVERAAAAGLDFVHFTGATGKLFFPEIAGAAGALLDYDGDGDLDVFLAQGTMLGDEQDPKKAKIPPRGKLPPSDRLYRNDLSVLPNGERRLSFTEVTAESGLAASTGYGMGAAAGDYDGDGHVDLYVTNFGSNVLWRNRGDGTFEDVTQKAGADDPRWSVSAVFFDADGDGHLDLYVGNYVDFQPAKKVPCLDTTGRVDYCGPKSYPPEPDRLLHNRGDGTFVDITAAAGLAAPGPALGVAATDFDGDGRIDLFVANDGEPNFLWMNQGDGKFIDEGLFRGTAVNGDGRAEASMGVDAADFDGDGDEDLFMTHLDGETNTLYLNDGAGQFLDASTARGVGAPSFSMTGFGTAWLDYDNDGHRDLLAVNGAVKTIPAQRDAGVAFPFEQRNQLLHNDGKGTFREVTDLAGKAFQLSEVSRGAMVGDLDNDGDPDVVVTNGEGPVRLLINQIGARAAWLGVEPWAGQGTALNARVEVRPKTGAALWGRSRPGGSYASSGDPRVLLGLGARKGPYEVRVYWPSGGVERWPEVAANAYTRLVRGTGETVSP